jgi:4-hydroxybenzoate polyprenyltransferase
MSMNLETLSLFLRSKSGGFFAGGFICVIVPLTVFAGMVDKIDHPIIWIIIFLAALILARALLLRIRFKKDNVHTNEKNVTPKFLALKDKEIRKVSVIKPHPIDFRDQFRSMR